PAQPEIQNARVSPAHNSSLTLRVRSCGPLSAGGVRNSLGAISSLQLCTELLPWVGSQRGFVYRIATFAPFPHLVCVPNCYLAEVSPGDLCVGLIYKGCAGA